MTWIPSLSPESFFTRTRAAKLALIALFSVAYVAAWSVGGATLVPHTISLTTFAWAGVLSMSTMALVVTAAMRARATRSIAHVLYEVENPAARLR